MNGQTSRDASDAVVLESVLTFGHNVHPRPRSRQKFLHYVTAMKSERFFNYALRRGRGQRLSLHIDVTGEPGTRFAAMGDTHLESEAAGPARLVDLVRSLVGSSSIFSVEHDCFLGDGDGDGNGDTECWSDNAADCLEQVRRRVCPIEHSPRKEAHRAGLRSSLGADRPEYPHHAGFDVQRPNQMFDFGWSTSLFGGNATANSEPAIATPFPLARGVQVPEHTISGESEPPFLVLLDSVSGAGQQTVTSSFPRRCNNRTSQRLAATVAHFKAGPYGPTGKASSYRRIPSFGVVASRAPPTQSGHDKHVRGIGKDVTKFHCKHHGCDKVYRSPDRVRKHCISNHREWFKQLQSSSGDFGPLEYCSWKPGR